MFVAVASARADAVHDWIGGPRPSRGRAARPCIEDGFGYAIDREARAGCARSAHDILLGTLHGERLRADAGRPARPDADDDPFATVRAMFAARGVRAARELNGPYALLFWQRPGRELMAVRDPIGLATLYYWEQAGTLVLSDRLDAFADRAAFDPGYAAQFIVGRGNPDTTDTIRRGVRAVPPGTCLRWMDGRLTTERFWSPWEFSPERIALHDAAAEFRALVEAAVRAHVDPDRRTWAHLSGGLDSSSVVSMAGAMAETDPRPQPLGGTITLRDSFGNADETEFVDTVVDRYGVANVRLADRWPWQADDEGPPLTDAPSRDYPLYARDRAMARAVASAGGTAILSGIGPDTYLPCTTAHCPDLLWSGRVSEAVRELHACSVVRRETVWRVIWTDGVLPLVSRNGSAVSKHRPWSIARWFTPRFREQQTIGRRLSALGRYAGERGGYYAHHVAAGLSSVAARLPNWLYAPGVEKRHPLLDRPLVEHCLRLPYDLRTDVYFTKPVLRAAMKGILPERIRTRTHAGITAPRIYWALRHERAQLDRLLDESILADLGCIEPRPVREALESFAIYQNHEALFLYALLSLETWLAAASGRSTVTENASYAQEVSHGEETHAT